MQTQRISIIKPKAPEDEVGTLADTTDAEIETAFDDSDDREGEV